MHYAKIENGLVTNVLVAEAGFFDTFVDTTPGEWLQTSYNTAGGIHSDGGTPLRKNYAGVGFTYDSARNAFIPPQPFPSWTLNETTCQWEPTVDYPDDTNMYTWNEETTNWVEVV